MTACESASRLLRECGPMHYRDLARELMERGLFRSYGKKPASSLNAMISLEIKNNGAESTFIRVNRGVFGLRALHAEGTVPEVKTNGESSNGPDEVKANDESSNTLDEETGSAKEEIEQRVRTPLFPTYRAVHHLLKIWPGRPRKQITGLHTMLNELSGTPQNTVKWSNPDTWIPERLSGNDRELANAIWIQSGKTVNPRYAHDSWLLSRNYGLIKSDSDGNILLTSRGRDFIDCENSEVELFIDEQEGLAKLLSLIADNGSTRANALLEEWTEYLNRHSSFRSSSTFRSTLWRRLNNLFDRGLVNRKGTMYSVYSVSDTGLEYLRRISTEGPLDGDEQQELRTLAKKKEASVRENMRERLLNMNPFAFEHLVKRLLKKMNYKNVEVTKRSGDGGVDVIGEIELGITSVREVVQAKRHKRSIQRKAVDELRGSLHRFDAVQCTIIATSRFSKGAEEAAFAPNVAPVTLIDGEKLVDLLIKHGIGVRKHHLEVLTIDPDAFSDQADDPDAFADQADC